MTTNFKQILKSQDGQTILEVLLAAMIVGLVVTAAAVGLTYSIKNNAEVRYRELATALAQEPIEAFRRERDKQHWTQFHAAVTSAEVYCFGSSIPSDMSGFTTRANDATCDSFENAKTEFRRSVAAAKPNDNTVELTVTVTWNVGDDKNERSITVNHWLKNWN